MTAIYWQVRAQAGPHMAEQLPNGVWINQVQLLLTDDPDRPACKALPPAICGMDARRARELAHALLTLADFAADWERAR